MSASIPLVGESLTLSETLSSTRPSSRGSTSRRQSNVRPRVKNSTRRNVNEERLRRRLQKQNTQNDMQYAIADADQEAKVKAALERRKQLQTIISNMGIADENADMVSELEQDRFFHCTVFEADSEETVASAQEQPAHDQPQEQPAHDQLQEQENVDPEAIVETTLSDPNLDNLPLLEEELNIPPPLIKSAEVNYTSWSDVVLAEQAANLYVIPGQEAFVDRAAIEAEKAQREADGLFVGDEPVMSSNLQARLMRDNWLTNSTVPHLKDLVYSYPVRSWKVLNHSTDFDNLMKPENVAKSTDPFEEAQPFVGEETPCYELCVNLTELRFLSHTLMSEEHKIEMNLIKKFENYVNAVKRHESSKVAESLQEYRYNWQMKRQQNLQFQGLQDSPSRNTVSSDLKTVIELRETLYLERFRIKAAMVEVLEEWDRLVSIREGLGYNSTRSKLIIYSTPAPDNDAEIWNRDIEDELEEEAARFQDRMLQYEHEMAEYRRYKSEMRANSGGDGDETDIDEKKKPKKPAPFNEPTEREKIEQRSRESRRGPGQPVQSLDLDVQGSLLESPDSMVNKTEKARRENARKARYILKYYFNSKEFFVSEKLALDTQFRLPAQDPLRVRTAEIPKSFKCQIYEYSLISNTYIGEVIFQIPTSSVTSNYPAENVAIFDNNPLIGGRVVYLSWWGKDPQTGALLVPTQLPSVFTQSHRQRDIYDPGFHLEDQTAIDDPNDPDFVPVGNTTGGQTFSGFVLNPFLSEGYFAPSEALESSKRLRVLKLRADDVAEFMGRKMIPLRDHEIKDSEIQSYEDRIMGEMDQDTSGLDHRKAMKKKKLEPSDREIIQRQRNRTRALVMERLRACNRILSYSDVIREDPLPELGQLIGNFGKFFEARRPLRPDRRDRTKAPTGGIDQVPKIIVSIRSANNLPVREQVVDEEQYGRRPSQAHTMPYNPMQGNQGFFPQASAAGTQYPYYNSLPSYPNYNPMDQLGASFNRPSFEQPFNPMPQAYQPYHQPHSGLLQQDLKPFVSVSFGNHTERTSVAFGGNPSWNEQIELDWEAGRNRLQSGFIGMDKEEYLFINIFDENFKVEATDNPDERRTSTSKHWIGGSVIPLSSLLIAKQIEGQIHLKVPPLLMGYKSTQDSNPATLELYIQIDAIYSKPEKGKQQLMCHEDPQEVTACENFLTDISKFRPGRNFPALVSDFKGETYFLCRFISPLPLPDGMYSEQLSLDQMMRRMARYVAMIPYQSDKISFAGMYDLWSNNAEFLSCLIGDDEEHALLLIAYFLQLNVPIARLIFGESMESGEAVWVLSKTEESAVGVLWNPVNGRCFRTTDPTVPLTSVTCMADKSNIYYNAQTETHPNRVDWSINSWRKLWSGTKGDLPTIQPLEIEYMPPDNSLASREARKIEADIKLKIREWRPGYLTKYRTDVAAKMRDILEKIEHEEMCGGQITQEYARRLLEPIRMKFPRHEVVGFPLHLPMTHIQNILDAVKAVELHKTVNHRAEFAVAVSVRPYPAAVHSLWVYLAQFTPK